MTLADIALATLTFCSSARFVAYVLRFSKAIRDQSGAEAISFGTWCLFLISHASTMAYALVNNHHWMMAFMFLGNAIGCGAILFITAWKRAKHRSRSKFKTGIAAMPSVNSKRGLHPRASQPGFSLVAYFEMASDPKNRLQPGGKAGAALQIYRSAIYRHNPDVGSQSTDPIRFCLNMRRPVSACTNSFMFRALREVIVQAWKTKGLLGELMPVLRNFRYPPFALFSAAH
jgi:hypothetical protein